MLLATRQDVADRLERELETSENQAVDALIDEASVTVEEYLRRDFKAGEDVPRAIAIVVSRMVARRMGTSDSEGVPDGVSSLSAIEYQASFTEPFVSTGVWLNRQDKMMLRRHRNAMTSMPLTSERS